MLLGARQMFLGTSHGGINMMPLIDRTITTIPNANDVLSIGAFAFAGCTEFVSSDFPNCTFAGIAAFWACHKLKSIDLPLMTETTPLQDPVFGNAGWGNISFCGGSGVENVRLNSMRVMPYNFFAWSYDLKTVHIDSCVELNDIPFQACNSLTDIYCPNLTTLAGRTFGYLGNISGVLNIHCDNRTTSQILSMSLSSHFGNTPQTAWNRFLFIGYDGTVSWDGSDWIVTPNA